MGAELLVGVGLRLIDSREGKAFPCVRAAGRLARPLHAGDTPATPPGYGEPPAGVLGPAAARLLRARPFGRLRRRRQLDGASRHGAARQAPCSLFLLGGSTRRGCCPHVP